MKRYLLLSAICLTSFFNKAFSQAPPSLFSHLMIVIDSSDFEKLVKNSFIKNQLGSTSYDTMQTSPLVISYYINGKNHFLHFTPNKGYFSSQKGTAYVIFQSLRPGQGDLLEAAWKQQAEDSIVKYDYTHPGFTLTEMVFREHTGLSKKAGSHLIPMHSSYSVESYKRWGLGDSAEVTMNQFLKPDSFIYFNKILSIQISITQKELDMLSSALFVAGYSQDMNRFYKTGEPDIIYNISNKTGTNKVTEMVLLLDNHLGKEHFEFGQVELIIDKDKALFRFK